MDDDAVVAMGLLPAQQHFLAFQAGSRRTRILEMNRRLYEFRAARWLAERLCQITRHAPRTHHIFPPATSVHATMNCSV